MKRFLMGLLLAWVLPLHAGEVQVDREAFGKLVLGQKADAVVAVLGKPESKGRDTLWEAIGEWVQEWEYPAQGLTLHMASGKKGGAKTLFSITASPGCELRTARGIRIGSTEAEVRRAYGKVEDRESGARGGSFVAGSVYGGVIFRIEKGKVAGIFIGAAAE